LLDSRIGQMKRQAFPGTDPLTSPKLKLDERVGLKWPREASFRIARKSDRNLEIASLYPSGALAE
jgi:hypothetical protein